MLEATEKKLLIADPKRVIDEMQTIEINASNNATSTIETPLSSLRHFLALPVSEVIKVPPGLRAGHACLERPDPRLGPDSLVGSSRKPWPPDPNSQSVNGASTPGRYRERSIALA